MLDYKVMSLCGGHLQLILLLGDVYLGLRSPVSLWRSPSVNIIIRCLCWELSPVSLRRSPSVYIIIRRCLCWIIDSSLSVEVTLS